MFYQDSQELILLLSRPSSIPETEKKRGVAGKRPSPVAQLVKNPPAMPEMLVQFLGWEDPLEKGQATHSRILGLPWWFRL